MPLTPTERSVIADAEKARLAYLSLHTGDPGTSGTSEATGGAPAYARLALSWGTSASGVVSATQVSFNAPAGTYSYVGYWTAVTAGTFLGGAALATAQTLSSQGVVQITPTLTITAS